MTALWVLQRDVADEVSCVGSLLSAGLPMARTLERGLGVSHPRIPSGTYGLGLKAVGSSKFDARYAELFPPFFGMIEVLHVPGRSEILLHCGNVYTDSEGCVLLGQSPVHGSKGWSIVNSQSTFKVIYPTLVGLIKTSGVVLEIEELS